MESIISHTLKKSGLRENHLLLSFTSFNDPDYVFCLLVFAYRERVCEVLITSQGIRPKNHQFIYHNLLNSSQVTMSFVSWFRLCICLFYVHVVTRILHRHAKFKHQNNFAELRPWQWKIPSSIPPTETVLCSEIVLWWAESRVL